MSLAFHAESVARKKNNQPPEWKVFRWEMVQKDTCKVSGGIPKTTKTGKESWKGVPAIVCYVHISEVEKERLEYSTTTGNCDECFGTGKELAGWSVSDGARYRACSKCKGTGKTT